jgi:glycine oxidase
MAGHPVILFDPAPARGATWAAAGMLAPSGEIAPGEESNYHLQQSAVAHWRDLASDLQKATGRELSIHESGTLLVGFDVSDRRLIEQFAGVATSFAAPHQRVTRESSPELFVALSPRINDGLLLAGDAWIDPDEAVDLLRRALATFSVSMITEEVLSVGSDDTGVTARTASDSYSGSAGILATGSLKLPEGALTSGEHTIRPVHGVTLRVQGIDRSSLPAVRAFVRGRNFYMVSRPGGYCVLGATLEERSEPAVQVGELQRLLRDALDIVPELETATVIEYRIGLRPASTDLQPFFERLATKGWAWSSGHYRHGVTLAPLAAKWALEYVEANA